MKYIIKQIMSTNKVQYINVYAILHRESDSQQKSKFPCLHCSFFGIMKNIYVQKTFQLEVLKTVMPASVTASLFSADLSAPTAATI